MGGGLQQALIINHGKSINFEHSEKRLKDLKERDSQWDEHDVAILPLIKEPEQAYDNMERAMLPIVVDEMDRMLSLKRANHEIAI